MEGGGIVECDLLVMPYVCVALYALYVEIHWLKIIKLMSFYSF